MKLSDEIFYYLDKLGAERIDRFDPCLLEFDIYGATFTLEFDLLGMRADITSMAFDEDRIAEEGLDIEDVVEVANSLTQYVEHGAFYASDEGEGAYCRVNFNFSNSSDFLFNLTNSLHQLLILREVFCSVVGAARVDAHNDSCFIYSEVEKARYSHIKDFLSCNILYVHGFRSTGNSATAQSLRELLPHSRVVSPDLPVNADAAVALLKKICEQEKIDVVVGTSMGGMLAQKLRGMPKVLVNPAFFVSETFKKNIGTVSYYSKRTDGATEFEITPEVAESYSKIEKCQFDGLSPKEIAITAGAFGTRDRTVDCEDDYLAHYQIVKYFYGEHRLDDDALMRCIIPLIAQLYRNSQRKSN